MAYQSEMNSASVGSAYQMYGSMQTTSSTMSSGSKYAPTQQNEGTYYTSADQYLQQSTTTYFAGLDRGSNSMMLASARPTDPSIAELAPMGDALLPLLLCAAVYAVGKILRKINLRHSLQNN